MSSIAPFNGLIYGWGIGVSGWDTGMDANIQRVDALLQIGALSKSLDAPSISSPPANALYIVPVGATAAFAGKDNQLAYYRGGVWFFIAPISGFIARVADINQWWGYTEAGAWVQLAAPVSGSGFADAANDGIYYVRHANGWVDLTTLILNFNNVYTKSQTVAPMSLTPGTNVAVDASLSNNFSLVQNQNCKLMNPSNLVAGTVFNFMLDMNGTGGWATTFDTLYKWPAGIPPIWVTTPNALNMFSAYYDGSILRCNGAGDYK